MTRKICILFTAVLFVLTVTGQPAVAAGNGLKRVTLLIIRHAEKPDEGDGLTPSGEARAKAYVDYFKNFKVHGEPLKLDAIFAAADSRGSRRPRLTVEPLASALGLSVNASYKDKDYQLLVDELKAHHEGKKILICWHHGVMSDFLRALGADPASLLPDGRWPANTYNWVIELHFDADRHLVKAQRIDEGF